MMVGCASSPKEPEALPPLVFPPPPDAPRFVFERTVTGSRDLQVVDRAARLRRMLTGETSSGLGFAKPFDVTVCQGRIYVSDSVQRSVYLFDLSERVLSEIGRENPGALTKPLGLDTDGECNLYVADGTAGRIHVYDQRGGFLRAIGGSGMFERLSHVAVDAEGERVYAVDTGGVNSRSHRVRVFDALTGEHRFDFGTRGDGAGEFNLPRDIAIGADGTVHVIDGGNFRVQVFSAEGAYLRAFGAVGRRYGQFSRPKGIALDPDGNAYVSDTAHGNFQVFDPRGSLLLFVGERGTRFERARYMLPSGIDVDEDGRVYLLDQFFRKLDIFRPAEMSETDGFLGSWSQGPAG